MGNNLKESTGKDFLLKLQKAVQTGNPEIGAEAIEKINQIHKLAENLDVGQANKMVSKRLDDAGERKAFTKEEQEEISLESEKRMLKIKAEEEKNKMISDIENSKSELKAVKQEYNDVQKQYEKVIELQEKEVKNLKIKYEAKYDVAYE